MLLVLFICCSPAPPAVPLPPAVVEEPAFALKSEEMQPATPLFEGTEEVQRGTPIGPQISRSRLSDPGVSSRLAQLEALLRRLIASPTHSLAETDDAPAGPGVFVLSDSDLTSSYYVEACRTLRIALGNLAKGRGTKAAKGKGESSLRNRLAEHLEISEAKVSNYLKQHCVVRWIQLDEEAPYLAHLAVAVLKPPLNIEPL